MFFALMCLALQLIGAGSHDHADKSYPLRDGSGVGVGAPQYGERRSLYAGLSTSR